MLHRRPLLVAALASAGLLAAMPAFADPPAQDASRAAMHDCARAANCDCHSRRSKTNGTSAAALQPETIVQGSGGYTASEVPLFTDAG